MNNIRIIMSQEDTAGVKYYSVFDQHSTGPADGWIEYPDGTVIRNEVYAL